MAHVLMMDNSTSGAKTQKQLGWTPVHPSLIADPKEGTNLG